MGPRTSGIDNNNPPQALLEVVRKLAINIEIIKKREDPFLKIFLVLSKKIAIDNGQTIFNQDPA